VVVSRPQHKDTEHIEVSSSGVYGLTESAGDSNAVYIKCKTPHETVYIVNLVSNDKNQANISIQSVMDDMPGMYCFGVSE